MAQITKWLHAIWDYMKKAKSSISMVFDLVSYYYQLLVVSNTWACVPRVILHMRMKKTYKYPPRFAPSTFD